MAAITDEVKRFYLEMAEFWHRPEILTETALHGHLHAFADSVKTEPDYARIWLQWSTAIKEKEGAWSSFLDFQKKVIALTASSIRRGQRLHSVPTAINAVDAARLFIASGYTITQLHFMNSGSRVVKRFVDEVIHHALN